MVDETPDALTRPNDWTYSEVSSNVQELNTMKEKVAYILNRFPETRNSDKALFVEYLRAFHGLNPTTALLDVVRRGDLPAQTAVARARAELQNKYKLYLPTRPEVLLKRQRRQAAYQQVFEHLDELDVEAERVLVLYSDESGVAEAYLIYGFVTFLRGRDNYIFTQRVLEKEATGGGPTSTSRTCASRILRPTKRSSARVWSCQVFASTFTSLSALNSGDRRKKCC